MNEDWGWVEEEVARVCLDLVCVLNELLSLLESTMRYFFRVNRYVGIYLSIHFQWQNPPGTILYIPDQV